MAYRFRLPISDVGRGISPSSGARLYFFAVGTSTPLTTYSDFALSVANAHPVVADANGRFGDIFLSGNADVSLRDSSDVLIYGPKTIYDPTNSVSGLAATAVSVTDAAGHWTGANVELILDEIGDNYMRKDRAETITGNKTFSGNAELISPVITDYSVKHNSISSASNVLTIDMSTGNSFVTTLTENVTTLTISNPPPTGYYGQFVLRVIQDGAGGAYDITQPASVKTPGGATLTISTANNSIDKLTYETFDGGTTWLLDYSQAYA